jgi:hypothetical protein
MAFVLTRHARMEMVRRGIPEDALTGVLESPEQIVPEREGLVAYQSRVDFGAEGIMLLRAIIEERSNPARVITVYRTSKVEKYWK